MRCVPSAASWVIISYLLQISFTTQYLIYIIWSAVRHGWWMHINPVVGCGVTVALFTIAGIIYALVQTHRDRVLDGISIHTLARCRRYRFMSGVSMPVALIWLVLCAAMTFAPKGKDFRNLFEQPPYTFWAAAVVLSLAEALMMVWTPFLVRLAERGYERHVEYMRSMDLA